MFIINLLARFIQLLPLKIALSIGGLFGFLGYYIFYPRTRVALDNLNMTLGKEKSQRELKKIARDMYRNFGKNIIEFMRIPILTRETIDELITIEGLENLNNAWDQKKGVLILTAHIGNWELLAATFAIKGCPVNLVTRDIRNRYINTFWMDCRRRIGINAIHKREALKEVIRRLRNNELVGFVLDQNVDRRDGVFVAFFGLPACTINSVAVLSKRFDAPVVPAFIIRQKDERHRVIFEKPILFEERGEMEEDIVYNTQVYTDIIERYIREKPEQWIWVHKRWKTRPI